MVAAGDEPPEPGGAAAFVASEQRKLTASYLNVVAGGFFTAGVAAPIAAAVFGVFGSGTPIPALTLVLGTTIFIVCSVGIHVMARAILKGLKP